MAKIEATVSPPTVLAIIVFTFAIPSACGCIHQFMGRAQKGDFSRVTAPPTLV